MTGQKAVNGWAFWTTDDGTSVGDLRADPGSEVSSSDLAWYEELGAAYRPEVVRLLLIGESPPDPGGGLRRFF
jgi:hypothetical protein